MFNEKVITLVKQNDTASLGREMFAGLGGGAYKSMRSIAGTIIKTDKIYSTNLEGHVEKCKEHKKKIRDSKI